MRSIIMEYQAIIANRDSTVDRLAGWIVSNSLHPVFRRLGW